MVCYYVCGYILAVFLCANIDIFIIVCKFFSKIMLFYPIFFDFSIIWTFFEDNFVDFFVHFVDNLGCSPQRRQVGLSNS